MLIRLRPSLALLIAIFALTISIAPAAAAVRTLNIDFGNAGAYVGGGGVLSSPGGTYWNQIPIVSVGPGQFNFGYPPGFAGFRDEFGDLLQANATVDIVYSGGAGSATASAAAGPLNDGVQLSGGFFGIRIAELSPATPVELVVYLNNPGTTAAVSSIEVNSLFAPPGVVQSSTGAPTGTFPGLEGRDYLRFTNLQALPTTIGFPPIPGIVFGVPSGGIANVAAIQVHGDFVPEPATGALALFVAGFGMAMRSSLRGSKP